MKLIRFLVFFVSITASNLLFAETTLTETSVNQLLKDVQTAIDDKNISVFASYFTDDSTITFVMPENLGGTSTLNKQQYIESLKQAWAMPAENTYEVKDIKIDVAPDGQSALATDVVLEAVVLNGKTVASTQTHETINIVLSEGAPRIKAIRGEVEIQTP
jgi:ketosteroid isomerase-like protein